MELAEDKDERRRLIGLAVERMSYAAFGFKDASVGVTDEDLMMECAGVVELRFDSVETPQKIQGIQAVGEGDPVSPEGNQCVVCGKSFASKKGLKQHQIAVHEKQKPYICMVCGKRFGWISEKSRCMRSHSRKNDNEKRPKGLTKPKKSVNSGVSLASERCDVLVEGKKPSGFEAGNEVQGSQSGMCFESYEKRIKVYQAVTDRCNESKNAKNHYKKLSTNMEILHANFNQSSSSLKHAGVQCTAISATAAAYASVIPPAKWTTKIMDSILVIGDALYGRVFSRLPDKENRDNSFLEGSEIMGHVFVNNVKVLVEAGSSKESVLGLSKELQLREHATLYSVLGLELALDETASFIITCNSFSFAVLKYNQYVYFFNSHSCDDYGLQCGKGKAAVLKIPVIDAAFEIQQHVMKLVGRDTRNLYFCDLTEIKCQRSDNVKISTPFECSKDKVSSAINASLQSSVKAAAVNLQKQHLAHADLTKNVASNVEDNKTGFSDDDSDYDSDFKSPKKRQKRQKNCGTRKIKAKGRSPSSKVKSSDKVSLATNASMCSSVKGTIDLSDAKKQPFAHADSRKRSASKVKCNKASVSEGYNDSDHDFKSPKKRKLERKLQSGPRRTKAAARSTSSKVKSMDKVKSFDEYSCRICKKSM